MSVLAIDLGTSSVKAIVWDSQDGVTARASNPVRTTHPHPGFDEQQADDWWAAVQKVLGQLPLDGVTAVGLSSQRETFVCLDENVRPIRAAMLWSDGRAPSPAARWTWLQQHEPDVAQRTRWLAAPKDFVLHRLVGQLVTDTTLASRTDIDAALLPEVVPPQSVVGEWAGAPVIAGAGDRTCEVFAVHASSSEPMVSWGTTANCSFPTSEPDVPAGWRASAYIDERTLAEAGLSAAGSALRWLAREVAQPVHRLQALAAQSPPGANGVICLPWLNGARAPWWRPDAQMTLLHETGDIGDSARAIYEGVAHDVRRALAQLLEPPTALRLAGGGANEPVWQEALSGITGLPYDVELGGDSAAIGAARLALVTSPDTRGIDESPVRAAGANRPNPQLAAVYRELARTHDEAAHTVLG